MFILFQLRHRYEQSIQERNDLGLQLIERNEEVCVFYEKMNVQESIIRQANLELTAREEELKFLRMEVGGVAMRASPRDGLFCSWSIH